MVNLKGLPAVIGIVFVTTYLVYVYPFFVLSHLIFETDIFNVKSFFLTVISASVILFYYRLFIKQLFIIIIGSLDNHSKMISIHN